jgi:hypothetical protein
MKTTCSAAPDETSCSSPDAPRAFFRRSSFSSTYKVLGGSCCVSDVDQMADGTYVGVGANGTILFRCAGDRPPSSLALAQCMSSGPQHRQVQLHRPGS